MKRDTVNYSLVGAFVVAMAVAFVVLLFAVTGRSGPNDTYFVYYDNVSGIKFGTSVFYEGYRVGQVEDIVPEATADGMRYRVKLSIAADWQIPRDSIASVQASGLIAAVSIEIGQGTSDEMLEPGAVIEGRGQPDLFAMLNETAVDLRVLSREGLLPLLHNVDTRVSELADELVSFRRDDLSPLVRMLHQRLDEELLPEAHALLQHLDESAQGLRALVDGDNQLRVREFLVHIDDVAVNLGALVERIEATRRQMDEVLAGLGGLVADNRDGARHAVETAAQSMVELELALETVNAHLSTIMYNLEGGSRSMSEFARAIRDNPARLIRRSGGAEPGSE